jgi:hypothetical protein
MPLTMGASVQSLDICLAEQQVHGTGTRCIVAATESNAAGLDAMGWAYAKRLGCMLSHLPSWETTDWTTSWATTDCTQNSVHLTLKLDVSLRDSNIVC